ncbi:MAG TPA: cation-translocating P-type ATPase [Chitinophagaceae bacterium]
MTTGNDNEIRGLTEQQVLQARSEFGQNEVTRKNNNFWHILSDIFKEPMVLLLFVAALLYFISGEIADAVFMTLAIVLVISISLYQESRSRNALAALKTLTQSTCKVIRDGITIEIKRGELVLGDYMIVEEGSSIPADGIIVQSNDFSVNESMLTGESLPVNKNRSEENNKVFQGTTVKGGLAICRVTAIGNKTELGKIGMSLDTIKEEDTPLQKQIRNFVKKMAFAGIIIFLIVWAINFYNSNEILNSLLKALTLAMSILPEEIPVAFTTFMALGAWRLMKFGIIVKQTKTVETLGSATVICTDKTGTITENRMSLASVFDLYTKTITLPEDFHQKQDELIALAMWASEPIPFDPMEIALHEAYKKSALKDERPLYRMIHEYPLGGTPPMMTHIFENGSGNRIIAAKGAPEAIIKLLQLSAEEKIEVNNALETLTEKGFRVLAVASARFDGKDFPLHQQDFHFHLHGLVAFYDPPKKNISEVFQSFYDAGITVKIITGDNAATTTTIAKQVGFRDAEKTLSGKELQEMSKEELNKKAMQTAIFTRMFPEAKLRILNALKANNQVVAMTGDGVNDGPALKTAHIGIAMGKKGTEIAKEVSSLILTDDDLAKMVQAIAMGRKIYANLKKAIQYIISIHIPIILTVLMPLVLGWVYPSIFSPVHVIFLELIMGPTCSIIYENEPIEKNIMQQRPRPLTTTFFNWKELSTSIVQGLAITAATLFIYQYAVRNSHGEAETRTMVFTTLISANIFLTLINRSFYYSIFTTLRYKNRLVSLIIGITIVLTALILYVPVFASFFQFQRPATGELLISVFAGFLSVIWFEIVKLFVRRKHPDKVF